MNNLQRARTIRLPANTDHARMAALVSGLQALDVIVEQQANDKTLKISYPFPAICFSTIWQLIKAHTDKTQFGLMARFRYALLANTEQIEREHRLAQAGWDIYVQDIFVASYQKDSARRASQKRKPWQQVKRPENPDQ